MPRPRKKPAWNDTAEGDALAQVLRNVRSDKLRAILKRDKMFTFRLSELDRETLDKAAKAVELPVSEYLIRIHYHIYESMKQEGIVK